MTKVGQFTVPAMSGLHAAATSIANAGQSDSQAAGIVPSFRQAQIVDTTQTTATPPSCTVTFDGVTNVAGVGYMAPYNPTNSDIVFCVVSGGAAWILGEITPTPIAAPVYTSNYVDVNTTGTGTVGQYNATSGAWTQVPYNNIVSSAMDDGTIYDLTATGSFLGRFNIKRAGLYLHNASATFTSSTAGTIRGVRIITQGGSVLAASYGSPIASTTVSCCAMSHMPTPPYYFYTQVYQDAVSPMVMTVGAGANIQRAGMGLMVYDHP